MFPFSLFSFWDPIRQMLLCVMVSLSSLSLFFFFLSLICVQLGCFLCCFTVFQLVNPSSASCNLPSISSSLFIFLYFTEFLSLMAYFFFSMFSLFVGALTSVLHSFLKSIGYLSYHYFEFSVRHILISGPASTFTMVLSYCFIWIIFLCLLILSHSLCLFLCVRKVSSVSYS